MKNIHLSAPEIGSVAPEFALPDENGRVHTLSDYRGQYVLLYFYPKDMTSGCTTEAKCFRDRLDELQNYQVQVLGVSADSVESHKKFSNAHHLNFPLLADTAKEVLRKYGVWIEKTRFGKSYMGTRRDSFLIDPSGVIVKHYVDVKPEKHVEEIFEDLAKL